MQIKSRIAWKWPCSCTNMHFYTIVVPIMQLFEFFSGRDKTAARNDLLTALKGLERV